MFEGMASYGKSAKSAVYRASGKLIFGIGFGTQRAAHEMEEIT
jgi:hypothetical protein